MVEYGFFFFVASILLTTLYDELISVISNVLFTRIKYRKRFLYYFTHLVSNCPDNQWSCSRNLTEIQALICRLSCSYKSWYAGWVSRKRGDLTLWGPWWDSGTNRSCSCRCSKDQEHPSIFLTPPLAPQRAFVWHL